MDSFSIVIFARRIAYICHFGKTIYLKSAKKYFPQNFYEKEIKIVADLLAGNDNSMSTSILLKNGMLFTV